VIWGYGIAVLAVAAALIIPRWPAIHLQTAPVSLFLCAVMFSAWLGGVGPGLVAIALSSLAFDYLMVNGIDAMKDIDGTRELAIKSQRTENEQMLLSVSDTGVGLPPQHADQIFSAFFTTKVQGTGMGLSISRTIIESHGGRLWASGNSGRGATFQFTLPATVAEREMPGHA